MEQDNNIMIKVKIIALIIKHLDLIYIKIKFIIFVET